MKVFLPPKHSGSSTLSSLRFYTLSGVKMQTILEIEEKTAPGCDLQVRKNSNSKVHRMKRQRGEDNLGILTYSIILMCEHRKVSVQLRELLQNKTSAHTQIRIHVLSELWGLGGGVMGLARTVCLE